MNKILAIEIKLITYFRNIFFKSIKERNINLKKKNTEKIKKIFKKLIFRVENLKLLIHSKSIHLNVKEGNLLSD